MQTQERKLILVREATQIELILDQVVGPVQAQEIVATQNHVLPTPVQLRVRAMETLAQLQAITSHTVQAQPIIEVQAAEVLQGATVPLHLPDQVAVATEAVHLQEAAVAVIEAVEVVAVLEVAAHPAQVVQEAQVALQEVQEVRVVHLVEEEDN